MTLELVDSPERIAARMKDAIEAALPGAEVQVSAAAPGHFEIEVSAPVFEGKNRVAQQQLVYGAITPFMSGDSPPVHAVDRLQTRIP